MKRFAKNDNGKLPDHLGLDKREGFEKFVECAKPSRHYHKSIKILYQERFTHKKIPDINPFIKVRVGVLFMRQNDVTSNRPSANCFCAAVGGLHNTRTSTCHNGEPQSGYFA